MNQIASAEVTAFTAPDRRPRYSASGITGIVSQTWVPRGSEPGVTIATPVGIAGNAVEHEKRFDALETLAAGDLSRPMETLQLTVERSGGQTRNTWPSGGRFAEQFNGLPTPNLDEGSVALRAIVRKRFLPLYSNRSFVEAVAKHKLLLAGGPLARRKAPAGFSLEDHDINDHGMALVVLRNSVELTEPLVAQAKVLSREFEPIPRLHRLGKWLGIAVRGNLPRVLAQRRAIHEKATRFLGAFDELFDIRVIAALPNLADDKDHQVARESAIHLYGENGVAYFIRASQASMASYAGAR